MVIGSLVQCVIQIFERIGQKVNRKASLPPAGWFALGSGVVPLRQLASIAIVSGATAGINRKMFLIIYGRTWWWSGFNWF